MLSDCIQSASSRCFCNSSTLRQQAGSLQRLAVPGERSTFGFSWGQQGSFQCQWTPRPTTQGEGGWQIVPIPPRQVVVHAQAYRQAPTTESLPQGCAQGGHGDFGEGCLGGKRPCLTRLHCTRRSSATRRPAGRFAGRVVRRHPSARPGEVAVRLEPPLSVCVPGAGAYW